MIFAQKLLDYLRIPTTAPFERHFPLIAKDPAGHDDTVGIFEVKVPVDFVVGSVGLAEIVDLDVVGNVGLVGVVGNADFPIVLLVGSLPPGCG